MAVLDPVIGPAPDLLLVLIAQRDHRGAIGAEAVGVVASGDPWRFNVFFVKRRAASLSLVRHGHVSARWWRCAIGHAPKLAADARAAGIESPDASVWCVTVMTRQGRDGTLGYVRDPKNSQATPAMAFDSGFVGGYLKHDALPVGAPSMVTLLPIAERCLEQREADIGLCNAAGQMLGSRAARGEIITMR